jgi:hypothetical protein
MNENNKMSPKKTIMAIIITGIVIIASVGGFFYLADSNGLFNGEVRVTGYAQGTNATQCYLYVDGVKVATEPIGERYNGYSSYYNQEYTFDNIKVKANIEHKFQIITASGDESVVVTEYIPFGQQSYLPINIIIENTPVYVRGIYNGSSTTSTTIHLYVDGNQIDSRYSSGSYYFTTEVYENQNHHFMVSVYDNMNTYENETTQYIGSSATTIWLNLG